jgi:hypothetical protein
MGTGNEREIVSVVEMLHDVSTKEEAGTTRRETPAVDFC